jgi:hypothetical protein
MTKQHKIKLQELSAETKTARKPSDPESLIDALQEPIPREPRQSRAVQTIRSKEKGIVLLSFHQAWGKASELPDYCKANWVQAEHRNKESHTFDNWMRIINA